MPIQHAIWTVGAQPQPLAAGRLPSEQTLEDMIVREPGILSNEWMLIGRQVPTRFGGRIDLLAIAPDGSLVLIELKRDRTPREIVAQALDYASWVKDLGAEEIAQIYQRFVGGGEGAASLSQAFAQRFENGQLDEETLNEAHQIVIVAAELDASTERIVGYLSENGIAINVVLFQVFEHAGQTFLSRAWLIDPGETQANVATGTQTKGEKESWNGEYYVSYGHRNWNDAVTYGFISGGGGAWYSQTLRLLTPGDRVWVKIPGTGYVGVGRVIEGVKPAKEFSVVTPAGEQNVLEVLTGAERFRQVVDDPALSEYFVRVQWLDTVPEARAVNEVGLFGNQNTVCQPRTPKWRHTVERLKTYFPRWAVEG